MKWLLAVIAPLIHIPVFLSETVASFIHSWGGPVTLGWIVLAVVCPMALERMRLPSPVLERMTLACLTLALLSYSLKTVSLIGL
ncbi:MAG: hypothetical protein KDD55_02280 [Bdellovibrionales bacterium]|nr:hypothetical protein [Bdellovibrionales bacterium]